jgi:hypothetical protein
MNRRLIAAMSCYACLALMATFTLSGKLRYFVWIVLSYFALRTYIAYKAGW